MTSSGAAQPKREEDERGCSMSPSEEAPPREEEKERVSSMSPSDEAKSKKEEGNKYYKDGDYDQAITLYSEALDCCTDQDAELGAVILANRAACYMVQNDLDAAIQDTSDAIDANPNYVKAYTRRFTAYERKEKWHEATADIKKAIELDRSLESIYGNRMRAAEMKCKRCNGYGTNGDQIYVSLFFFLAALLFMFPAISSTICFSSPSMDMRFGLFPNGFPSRSLEGKMVFWHTINCYVSEGLLLVAANSFSPLTTV
eukprot:GHVU01050657.1.p1 GENE.GHVU01050657.1~~GHVU01050657.1.p1  ORF type:complete len:257 (+),score=40.23 GHVU01050657.1:174-944(+)